MDTNKNVVTSGRRRRQHHSVFFKAEAVGECQVPGVSIAAVALRRGLNANLLRRWVKDAESGNAPIAIRPAVANAAYDVTDGFVPVSLPPTSAGAIQVEFRCGKKQLSLTWPASKAHECAMLLRALMK